MSDDGLVVDEEVLEELREDLGDAFPGFVRQFLDGAPETLARIEGSLGEADTVAAGAGAHTLKGTAGYLGAAALVRHLTQLQIRADEGELDAARQEAARALVAFAALERRLAAEIADR